MTINKRYLKTTCSALTSAAAAMVAIMIGGAFAGLAIPRTAAAAAERLLQTTLSTAKVRETETEAGNLLADAVRAAGSAEIGLVPAAAFKPDASVPRPANAEQAANLVEPASDMIVILSLRGAQVLAALERSVSFAPQASAGFLQVSGLRFTYDTSRPGGKRVVTASLNSAPLDAARVYKIATTKPLANGQQGYFQIWDKDQVTGETGKSLTVALADLGKARGGSLTAALDGRITRNDK